MSVLLDPYVLVVLGVGVAKIVRVIRLYPGRIVRGFQSVGTPPAMIEPAPEVRCGAWIGGYSASWPFITLRVDSSKLVILSKHPFTPPILVLRREQADGLRLDLGMIQSVLRPRVEDPKGSGVVLFVFRKRAVHLALVSLGWLSASDLSHQRWRRAGRGRSPRSAS